MVFGNSTVVSAVFLIRATFVIDCHEGSRVAIIVGLTLNRYHY